MRGLLFRDDAYLRQCEATVVAADARGIQLDRTVFYPTGGGQPGDSGTFRLADGRALLVADARKGDSPDAVLHVLTVTDFLPAVGTTLTAEIDWARRHRLMRMHTCLHLLSAVLPYPVTGGQVGDGKGRLDFDIAEVTLDKEAITERLNILIGENHPVGQRWITDDELSASPELVKTMSVRPPSGAGRVRLIEVGGLDLQACGGTHVARTGEIGRVVVRKIESKGRQNRRVALELA
jgi:misacylated tRNA(Ala) deacylase